MGDCEKLFLPDQAGWSHDKKVELSKRKGTVNRDYFLTITTPLNKLAKDLKLKDSVYIYALSSLESGWLNEENAWLKNPFGLTMAGKDNLGFDSIQQACDYWKCKYAQHVSGATSMTAFLNGLRTAKYNSADAYFAYEKWNSQIKTVQRWSERFGYVFQDQGGTLVIVPKPR